MHLKDERPYNRSCQVQRIVLELIEDVNLKLVTLWSVKIKGKRNKHQWNAPFVPGLLDQGKNPRQVWYWNTGHTRSDTISNSSSRRLTCESTHRELFACWLWKERCGRLKRRHPQKERREADQKNKAETSRTKMRGTATTLPGVTPTEGEAIYKIG